MGIKEWVSKKLLSDNASRGGATAATERKLEDERLKEKAEATERAREKAERDEATKAVEAIKFKRGGVVKKSTSFKW